MLADETHPNGISSFEMHSIEVSGDRRIHMYHNCRQQPNVNLIYDIIHPVSLRSNENKVKQPEAS